MLSCVIFSLSNCIAIDLCSHCSCSLSKPKTTVASKFQTRTAAAAHVFEAPLVCLEQRARQNECSTSTATIGRQVSNLWARCMPSDSLTIRGLWQCQRQFPRGSRAFANATTTALCTVLLVVLALCTDRKVQYCHANEEMPHISYVQHNDGMMTNCWTSLPGRSPDRQANLPGRMVLVHRVFLLGPWKFKAVALARK